MWPTRTEMVVLPLVLAIAFGWEDQRDNAKATDKNGATNIYKGCTTIAHHYKPGCLSFSRLLFHTFHDFPASSGIPFTARCLRLFQHLFCRDRDGSGQQLCCFAGIHLGSRNTSEQHQRARGCTWRWSRWSRWSMVMVSDGKAWKTCPANPCKYKLQAFKGHIWYWRVDFLAWGILTHTLVREWLERTHSLFGMPWNAKPIVDWDDWGTASEIHPCVRKCNCYQLLM